MGVCRLVWPKSDMASWVGLGYCALAVIKRRCEEREAERWSADQSLSRMRGHDLC
jgi:hypothetical protein